MMTLKEEDIRPADLFAKYLEMTAKDAEAYFAKAKRLIVPCPACGELRCRRTFNKWNFEYVSCEECNTLYQSPRPERKYFEKFYQESPSSQYWAKIFFPAVAEVRRKKLFYPKAVEILNLCAKDDFQPTTVADVGAGYGILLEELKNLLPEVSIFIAIEPNSEMADICRRKDLIVKPQFVEHAESLHGRIDLAISLEVLEHTYDPFMFCCSIYNLLRPGGRVLLTTLSVSGFDIQVLWEESKSVSPPHHINFISIDGFYRLMERAGFKNVEIFTPGKLDVDIVKNALKEKTDIEHKQRFIRSLLDKDDDTLTTFQQFLAEHQLSSHCWIWAIK